MQLSPDTLRTNICLKSFLIGLGAVLGIYALLFLYVLFKGNSALESLQGKLASHAIVIEHAEHTQDVIVHEKPDPISKVQDDNNQNEPLAEALGIAPKSKDTMLEAPLEGYYEESEYGPLPIKKNGRLTPFSAYKKPFPLNQSKSALAVAILDYGLSETLSEKILSALPANASLILSPYAIDPDKWQKRARRNGHEIWMSLPVETLNFPFVDPGNKGLLTSVSLAYNQERLGWTLGRTSGYAGVAAYTDDALLKSSSMFNEVFTDVFSRGLGFFELNTDGGAFVHDIAKNDTSPYAKADASLKIFNAEARALSMIEKHIQEQHKRTSVLVRPTAGNLDDLADWLKHLEEQGVQVVPVSAVANIIEGE